MAEKIEGARHNGRTYTHYAVCESCGAQLVPQRRWNRMTEARRALLRKHGARKQAVGPYCGLKGCQDERARREQQ